MTALLRAAAQSSVRIICAPVGSGKTAALQHYVGRTGALYVNVRTRLLEVGANAAAAFGNLPADADEVVFDEFDAASPEVIGAFLDRIAAGREQRRYVFSGTSRARMRVSWLLAHGVGTLVDAAALAFTTAEVACLADRYAVSYCDEDLVQLLHYTDGWPIAVHWIIRDAARSGWQFRDAFEAWRHTRGHLLSEYVLSANERDTDAFLEYLVLLRRGSEPAEGTLERFEALGFPVLRTRTSLRPYRVLSRLASTANEASPFVPAATQPVMTVKLLGRFRCEVGGVPIAFARRRDQNVFTFVALSGDGRANRRELLDAFWPGVDGDAARQGLRTALSRIRRAIGAVTGPDAVDLYLRSADAVSIDRDHVTVDVGRFLEHDARGQIEEAKGDAAAAKRYYAAADRLYTDRFLSAEAVDPCFEARVEELETTYKALLSRMIALHVADEEHQAVHDVTSKLLRRPNSLLGHTLNLALGNNV